MGKGDIKTRRGKLFKGSYGVLRPRKRKLRGVPAPEIAKLKEAPEKVTKTKARSVNKNKESDKKVELVEDDVKQETVTTPKEDITTETIDKDAKTVL